DDLRKLMDDMLETMYSAPGIGLAAVQIGILKRLIVIDITKDDQKKNPIFLINPKIIKKSKIYVSECWGVENQRDYLNMVVAIKAIQKPTEVLKNILIIENDMGRVRKKKWDSRIIDIDILFFDKKIINEIKKFCKINFKPAPK
ncbi:MAG: 2-amino-4-hydroxy-6-hydroxymethyldihydropteridine diphosphokinase, partial [SAR324 cluster bacterium]|nr:2-amino-4-hydroxy-6-hydroxymethyldihydropteridine diphosphokinase [SAR324 cluster bacterium]